MIFHGYVGHNQIVGASVSQQHEQRGYGCVMQNYCTRMCHMCTNIIYRYRYMNMLMYIYIYYIHIISIIYIYDRETFRYHFVPVNYDKF